MSAALPKMRPAARRYAVRIGVSMGLYVAVLVPVVMIAEARALPAAPWLYLVAMAPAAPVGGVIFALLRYLEEEEDEYQRLLHVRTFVVSSGLTLAVTTGWGFLQFYAAAPLVSLFYVFPLFWACYGVAGAWVRWRASR
jgi:hypothetical protein